MVRLKVLNVVNCADAWIFQFQYGAIERVSGGGGAGSYAGFQFQYGAIERLVTDAIRVQLFDFNSSMVRLKVIEPLALKGVEIFQFQYGAIESSYSSTVLTIPFEFQFQYGAIESV